MKIIIGRYMKQGKLCAKRLKLNPKEYILISTESGSTKLRGRIIKSKEDIIHVGDWYAGKFNREIQLEIKHCIARGCI